MAYSNGIVTAPISVYDIRSAVGLTTGDLGTLISNGTINMWAKYKPVTKAIIDTTGQLNSDKTWNTGVSDPWWKGTLNDYGIAYNGGRVSISFQRSGIVDALTTLATKITGGKNGWTYLRPSGGSSSPYRYLDFNRYNRNASNPVSGLRAEDVTASSTSAFTCMMDYRHPDDSVNIASRDYLVVQDIVGSGWYLGFAIYKKSGSTYTPIAWVTGTQEWNGLGINSSSGADGITSMDDNIAITKLKSGSTYYILPVFANIQLSQPSENQSQQITTSGKSFLTVPYTNFVSFTATQRSTSQMVAVPQITNRKISTLYTFATTVQLNSTVDGYVGGTAYNVTYALVNELYNGTIASGNYADYQELGNITVGADEVKNVYSMTVRTLDASHTWRVLIWVNGELKTIGLIAPRPIE